MADRIRKKVVGTPTGAGSSAHKPSKEASKTKPSGRGSNVDAVVSKKTSGVEAKPNKNALRAGDARLGRSTDLLSVLLSGDKTSYLTELGDDGTRSQQEIDLAKRVALKLQTMPYGTPAEIILSTLRKDPVISKAFPKVTMEALRVLHETFPSIVPLPHIPVDVGPSYSPTLDGYIDLWATNWASAKQGELGQLAAPEGRSFAQLFTSRYTTKSGAGLSLEHHFPAQYHIYDKAGKVLKPLGFARVALRRTITGAPPTWTAEQIATSYNEHLDFHTAMFAREGETLAAAKQRLELSASDVESLMAKFPSETGTTEFFARRSALRDAVTDAIGTAKAGDNLYKVLLGVCDRLSPGDAPLPKNFGSLLRSNLETVDSSRSFDPIPSSSASLTPEDILPFISGDPALAKQIETLLDSRSDTSDKHMAQRIAAKFKNKLNRYSLDEIVDAMKAEDPAYNRDLVLHLMSSFPEILGGPRRVSERRVEAMYLVATQVASLMDNMYEGATLDDVAAFMKAQSPDFERAYPDFTGGDVEILQACYDFVPSWDVKPDGSTVAGGLSMELNELAELATEQLGLEAGGALHREIIETVARNLQAEEVPDELHASIDDAFRKGMMNLVMKTLLNRSHLAMDGPTAQRKTVLDAFLRLDPAGQSVNHTALTGILASVYELNDDQAGQIATALLQARDLDVRGARTTMMSLTKGNTNAELVSLKLSGMALGREALTTRVERDIFRNRALKASFARSSRIPLHMPMVQDVVDKYKDQQPLEDTNVLMVQHMLGQAYPQIKGYKDLGMDCENCIFVGIPYHENHEVEEAIARSFGVDSRVPPRDMAELYRAIEKGVDDLVASVRDPNKPDTALIVCDGPHAREYFMKKYVSQDPELAKKVRFTEQTAYGDRESDWANKDLRVVSYARTELKSKEEAKFIGQAIARSVNAALTAMGTGVEEKPVLINGLGPVGLATAEAMKGQRSEIYAYDPELTDEMREWAEQNGITILTDPDTSTVGKFLTIGCSGYQSVGETQWRNSEHLSVFGSGSSKLAELDMQWLHGEATDESGKLRRIKAAEVNNQETYHYWLEDGTIRTVIAGGLPVNFNDINSVPPEFIDMTMALGLAAAVQTMLGDETCFERLNDEDADSLYQIHKARLEEMQQEAREASS